MISLAGIGRTVTLADGESLEILRHVDLEVGAAEAISIMGRSGSGKSTLLNILGLLDVPTTGTYRIDNVDVGGLPDRGRSTLRGRSFGFVFQQFHLLEGRTALENVAAPLAHADLDSYRRRNDLARELLCAVGLEDRLLSPTQHLSGGEQQRVAIARALIRHPAVLLADEPTGSLDPKNAEVVLQLLLDLVRAQNASLVLVTHDPIVGAAADRRLRLEGGVLVAA